MLKIHIIFAYENLTKKVVRVLKETTCDSLVNIYKFLVLPNSFVIRFVQSSDLCDYRP